MRAVVALILMAGCASIHTTESITDVPLDPSVSRGIRKESLQHEVTADIEGYTIELAVVQSETCWVTTTARSHRTRHVRRVAEASTSRTIWGIAVTSLAGGIYAYADAERLSADASASLTAPEYRQAGTGLFVLGAAAAIVGLIDQARASDSEVDDGVIDGVIGKDEHTCRRRKTRQRAVSLVLTNGDRLEGVLDEQGVATLSFLPIPEEGAATDGPMFLLVDNARLRVDLTPDERKALHDALLSNPRSRVALDVLEKRRATCATAVASARAMTPVEPSDLDEMTRGRWVAAKRECGDLWTPELDVDFATIERRVVASQCKARLAAAERRLQEHDDAGTEDLATEIASIRGVCTSVDQISQLDRFSARVVVAAKRAAREREAEARRAAREEARAASAERRALQEQARKQRSWGSARLRCNDGTLSPTCNCGRSSNRGCCSWHGGVAGCSAD